MYVYFVNLENWTEITLWNQCASVVKNVIYSMQKTFFLLMIIAFSSDYQEWFLRKQIEWGHPNLLICLKD